MIANCESRYEDTSDQRLEDTARRASRVRQRDGRVELMRSLETVLHCGHGVLREVGTPAALTQAAPQRSKKASFRV